MAHRLERFADRWSTLRSARSPSWLIWAMRWLRAATARPRPRWRLTQMDAEPEAALMMLERKQKHNTVGADKGYGTEESLPPWVT
jgi:hypothetical protein